MSRINDKILLVAIGIWIGTSTAFGQEETSKKNEVSLNFGLGPFLWSGCCGSDPDNHYNIYGFVVTAQYMRQVVKGFDVGIIAGWYPAEDETDVLAMLAFRGNWVNKPSLKVYTELDIGCMHSSETDISGMYGSCNGFSTSLQYTLAGVNFGLGKNFFGQAEFGLGSKGLLNIGIGYKF